MSARGHRKHGLIAGVPLPGSSSRAVTGIYRPNATLSRVGDNIYRDTSGKGFCARNCA